MFRSPVLDEIETLDPPRDHQRIVLLSCRQDFPFDTTRALELALFRTFAVPGIAALLAATGEFETRPQKRYDDTDILVSELFEHGHDSERGRRAIARINSLHGRFAIRNEDFLYVLSTFVFEPIRWNERYGWRRMVDGKRLALFHFWRAVGARMGIRAIPEDYAAFERFNLDFERRNYRCTEATRRVGTATRELFAGWFPRPVRPLVRRFIHAIMDEPLLEAFAMPKPGPGMRRLAAAVLRARALLLRAWPRRRRPHLRTAMRQPSYPRGYEIESVGPPVAAGEEVGGLGGAARRGSSMHDTRDGS